MGSCLDTEKNSNDGQAIEESQVEGRSSHTAENEANSTRLQTGVSRPNVNRVQFESPKVPVIFVLGGPGSGKVTHCDNLMQEKNGIVHINMTDLLQQYSIGTDMQDFGLLSSKTVAEVLMLEMKMAPNAKTFLVSGYPRNMRDVVEYGDKISMITGVVVIAWRQKMLERQINYGAKLGQVVITLARMELNNFFKNVTPVIDYFDEHQMLIHVNGERPPEQVYQDFRNAIFEILGTQDNPPDFANGLNTPTPTDGAAELPTVPSNVASVERERAALEKDHQRQENGYPPVLWVIGGPGCNKSGLCTQVAKEFQWSHIGLGGLLRAAAQPPDPRHSAITAQIRVSISEGELVPLDIVMKYVRSHMGAHINAAGIILDGFPRNLEQVEEFEQTFKQQPVMVLLDCSKLMLGRGRIDDSVSAFRRRLEIFRQSSLPMLKEMDKKGRLVLVDGDTDKLAVQDDFRQAIKKQIVRLNDNFTDKSLELLEDDESQAFTEISPSKDNTNSPLANGHIPNKGFANKRATRGTTAPTQNNARLVQ